MTVIPLVVPDSPPQWVLLDLQGDLTLRQPPPSSTSSSTPSFALPSPLEKPLPNCVEQYGGLELGAVHLHRGRPQLRIGNHLLDVQLRTLPRPFLVLTRGRHLRGAAAMADGAEDVRLHCVAVVRLKVSVVTRPVPVIVSTPGPMPALS